MHANTEGIGNGTELSQGLMTHLPVAVRQSSPHLRVRSQQSGCLHNRDRCRRLRSQRFHGISRFSSKVIVLSWGMKFGQYAGLSFVRFSSEVSVLWWGMKFGQYAGLSYVRFSSEVSVLWWGMKFGQYAGLSFVFQLRAFSSLVRCSMYS
jgi:nitrogen fixation-related uncharacterized protein